MTLTSRQENHVWQQILWEIRRAATPIGLLKSWKSPTLMRNEVRIRLDWSRLQYLQAYPIVGCRAGQVTTLISTQKVKTWGTDYAGQQPSICWHT